MLITCRICKTPQPTANFHRAKREKSGYHSDCKTCRKAEHGTEWYKAKKETLRQRYAEDAEFRLARRASASRNYELFKERKKLQSRKSALKRFFKMTVEEYEAKASAQNYRCKICGRPALESNPHKKDLGVDH